MSASRRIVIIITTVVVISLLLIVGLRSGLALKAEQVNKVTNAESLVRLHVIANSNSLQDQRIKRDIRDRIIQETTKLYNTSPEGESTPQKIIKEHFPQLKEIIKAELREQEIDYGVELKLGRYQFPTRSYSGLTLPAGKYQALRVVLGSGQGENWWCVLFPPLCFVDSIDQVSEEEVNQLAIEDKEELPVEFKFKLVEVIENNPEFVKSKLKLAHILETSFPGLSKIIFSNESNSKAK
ncbi:stage II sporulation protein R [Halanaerobaculum tunisiense]